MAAETTQDVLFRIVGDAAIFIETVQEVMGGMDKMDQSFGNVEKRVVSLDRIMKFFVANTLLTQLVGGIKQVVGWLKTGFDWFVNFAKGATVESGRIEVQWRTLSATAAKMGVSFKEASRAIGDLRSSGIKTSEALQVMTQWLSAGLPSDKLKELSRAAQDLAIVLGTDSTQAMERFNWFVQSGNSELLRTVGIMQTSTQMENKFAASIGKTREQLSDKERRLARVEGLLQSTAAYAGLYEKSLSDPFKRMTSLVREFSNVVEVVGHVFVPILGAAVDIASDLLEKIESLFRVTKKESKETGRAIGEWKEGFLKLRAVVTAFANWFKSIWERVTSGFSDRAEGMMDKFVNAIIRGVKAAAEAIRKFASFLAGVFGGRAPGAVTEAGIAAVKPEARPVKAAPPPPVAVAAEVMADPEAAAKLRAKPVAPAKAEDLAKMSDLTGRWAAMTRKLAEASKAAAKARTALAKAEDWLERASEKVYDIQRKIARLQADWAEIPERFTRGRQKQLDLELAAARHEEHERKKVVNAERERLQLAEKYERQVQKTTDSLKGQIDKLADSIAKQAEKYGEWLEKLTAAEAVSIVEPVQAVVDEFESLDDLTAGYLEEIEGELMPAFASIELSVASIVENLKIGIARAKEFGAAALAKLAEIRNWFDGLPPWVKKVLMGAIALMFVPGLGGAGAVMQVLSKLIFGGFSALGILSGPGLAVIGGVLTLSIALWPLANEEVRAKWKDAFETLLVGNFSEAAKKMGEAFSKHMKGLPFGLGTLWETQQEMMGIASPEETTAIWAGWIDRITDVFGKKKPEMERAATEAIEDPLVAAMDRADRRILRESILPTMITDILDWLQRMAKDSGAPLDEFARIGIDAFQKVANEGLDLTGVLDTLIGRVNILASAMKGFPAPPKALALMAEGSFKVITLNQNFTGAHFGSGSEDEIRDVVLDAIRDVIK